MIASFVFQLEIILSFNFQIARDEAIWGWSKGNFDHANLKCSPAVPVYPATVLDCFVLSAVVVGFRGGKDRNGRQSTASSPRDAVSGSRHSDFRRCRNPSFSVGSERA